MAAPAGKGCVSNEDTLFQERSLCSVTANTRQVGEEFLALAARVAIRMDIVSYPMSDALCALSELAHGCSGGAAVICLLGGLSRKRVEGPWSLPMNRDRLT